MAIITIDELKRSWPQLPSHKLIGIDWGEKRIGIAVSDRSGMIASPLQTFLCIKASNPAKSSEKHDHEENQPPKKIPAFLSDATLSALGVLIQKEAPVAVILGLPKNMDGSCGFQAQKAQQFGQHLCSHITCPLTFWDERLSSAAIERLMVEADWTRKKRSKHIDKSAAAFVLQGVLDFLNRPTPSL